MAAERLRVLLIDDNPDDRQLAIRELERGFPGVRVTEAANRQQFERAVADRCFDLTVTDFELKWSDGISVLRALKSSCPDVPVVMFTGSGSEEVAVEAMKAGLDDYVIKSPKHFVRLNLAVRTCLRAARANRRATLLEVRQQQLLNRLAVGVCRLTLDGELLESNQAFLRLCGAETLDAARKLDLTPLLPAAAEREYLLAHPSDDGYHVDREATLVRVGGASASISVNATLSTGTGGDEKVLDCVVEDITARKKLIDDLRSANRAKDQLLALVSHELRTPLTPVLAAVSAMQVDPRLPDDLRDDLRVVRENVEQEARLVNDLLDLTGTTTAGEMKLHFETVDAHAAVAEAVALMRASAAEKALTMTLRLDATNRYVWADPVRIRQALSNLLANSIKFTPGGGEIIIATTGQGGQLLLRITDTGIGIAPEHLPHIFEPFNQGDLMVSRRFGGLGLGLSITKGIMEAHGGDMTVESEGRERGTTFTLRLKSVDARAAESAPASSAPPPVQATIERGPLRVLLVEDHDDTRRVMSRLLRSFGHDVTGAATVGQALEELRTRPFDLLLSDLGLPDGTGWDLMREAAEMRPIKGIALSGFGAEEDLRRSKEAGFVEHLTKPVDVERLEAAIRGVLV